MTIVRRKLVDLTSNLGSPSQGNGRQLSLSSDGRFQQQLLLFVLSDIMGFQNVGRSEKTAWEIRFGFHEFLCVAAFRKFGLKLEVYPSNIASKLTLDAAALDLADRLADAVKLVERHVFQDFIGEQVDVGAVGVVNQLSRLRGMYKYFRELTDAAHQGDGQLSHLPSSSGMWMLPAQTEGFYTTVAMVNAYFSYLEHLFVLMLPFSRFDASKESLVSFIGLKWGDKFKRIIPLGQDMEARKFYERLRSISEEFRNTHVHGGFDKSHGGLTVFCVHGALHADIKNRRGGPYYELVPMDQADFDRACAAFDEFDTWLAPSKGYRWANSGLAVAFGQDAVAAYTIASADDKAFEELLDFVAELEDRNANMDW